MAALIPSASATGSGTMTLAGPSTNSNQTVSIPDATGTMMVSGNMPAFSAYASANQSVTSGVYTKVQFNTEQFDTANCYDNATNYRFTPNVAGYYQVNILTPLYSTATTIAICTLYKNGAEFLRGQDFRGATFTTATPAQSTLIYLNGSTDYIEAYAYISGAASQQFLGGLPNPCYFQASLVRSA